MLNLKYNMFTSSTRILIIDDMVAMRKMISTVCKELGFECLTEAADGAIGWGILNQANPAYDLIISDMNMPNCTGLDLLKRVRKDSRLCKTPFLMVTAEAEPQTVAEVVKAGVDHYIVKHSRQN